MIELPQDNNERSLYFAIGNGGVAGDNAQKTYLINNVMFVEGNHTDKNYKYFEGMKSSFENQLITQDMIDKGLEKSENLGKYKVEVKSNGKNLFDEKTLNDYIIDENEDLIRLNYVNMNVNFFYPINSKLGDVYTFKYQCKETIGGKNPRFMFIYDDGSSKDINTLTGGELREYKSTSDSNKRLIGIRVTYTTHSGEWWVKKDSIQLEKGSAATEYEPYRESIKIFYLNSPLLKGDTIEYINGQAIHIKRYNQLIFDGSEDESWVSYKGTDTHHVFTYKVNNIQRIPSVIEDSFLQDYLISDKFHTKSFDSSLIDFEAIRPGINNDWIMIAIDWSNLSTQDIDGFKEWLSQNPVIVVYKLAKPVYEPIKEDLSIQLFENTTRVSNNSIIPANMEVTVDRVLNRAKEALEVAKSNPTMQNIAIARMWINLVGETLKKDEFQEELDSITDIVDLEIEKKTVTANMDIYVKSANMLSMSLNTNSITFEGYSGTSSLEMKDAVEISINSSLPYTLNASIESPIQNKDGTSVIPSDILNIKESADTDYKVFSSIGDKIKLSETSTTVNEKMHKIDFKLNTVEAYKPDVYKTTVKFEAIQN